MKFKYLFFTLLLGCFLLVLPKSQTVFAVGCLTRTVTFNGDSTWNQGPITVQCYGDSIPGPHDCHGDIVTLSPGQSANLDHCSCNIPPGDAPDGCLHIVSTPNSCNASIVGGDQSTCGENGQFISSNITGSCQATPLPSTDTPVPEVPTATPTPVPAATSAPVPTSTPTPVPAAIPTPGFSAAMCKCDGIDATPIFPGANVSFNAFAKVFGTDTNLATIRDITFSVYESPQNQPNTALRIAQSSPISSQVISQDSSAVRYKSTWNFTFPAAVNASSLYRVIAQINCVKKIAMAPPNVLAAETQPSWIQDLFNNIFKRPFDLISGLFGGGGSDQLPSAPTATTTPTQNASQRNTLQLQTIQPAKTLEKSCSLIKFQFNNQ